MQTTSFPDMGPAVLLASRSAALRDWLRPQSRLVVVSGIEGISRWLERELFALVVAEVRSPSEAERVSALGRTYPESRLVLLAPTACFPGMWSLGHPVFELPSDALLRALLRALEAAGDR